MSKRGRPKHYHLYQLCGNKYYNVNNFFSKITIDPCGCHLWTGAKHRQGYGMCGGIYKDTDARFMTVTHRAAMEIFLNRDLSSDEAVVHQPGCPPNCVNPNHLQIGDLKLRNAVMVANGRAGRGRRGPSNEPYNGVPKKQNRVYKYSEDEIRAIRRDPTDVTAARYGWTRKKASHVRWEMIHTNYRWLV